MNIGFIGCGGMGFTHIQCLKKLSETLPVSVTAISDRRSKYLDRALEVWPDAKGYEEGINLIRNESVDLVFICTPSYLHTELVLAAMKKEMDVFVEKPVCLKQEECDALLAQYEKTPVNIIVGQVVRSMKEYLFLKELCESKEYGALKAVMMQRVSGNPIWGGEDWFHDPEKSGSVVLDLHIHDVDFLRCMLGEPDSLEVSTARFDSGMINHIVANFRFGQVMASAEGVWHIAPNIPFEASYRADFEKATVRYAGLAAEPLVIYTADGQKIVPKLADDEEDGYIDNGMNIKNFGAYFIEDQYFLTCLLNQKKNERATLQEGIRSVQLGLKELKLAGEA